MPDPEGSNDSTRLQNFSDSAPAPPSEPGPSTSAVQAPGGQEPLPNGVAYHASAVQPEQAFFGVRKQDANRYQHPQNVVFNDDYDKRLPEDPYCEETAPNARVWRMYVEEAAAFDAVFVGQARDGLDVMLVFAGLFSAVVTSFLVQVSQSLQADYTAMTAILLHDLVAVQLSIADGPSSLRNITAPSVNPLQTFRPDSITVWVNGLWVVSLTASLVVALSAVLVKQWLHHYTSIPSGTPGARSHLRQYRFIGLQKWRVSVIIGLFPVIMHISLALFLAGLILFFIPLRTSLACAVGVITAALCLLYLVSNALPIFFPQCPYQTPLTDFIHHTSLIVKNAQHSISGNIRRLVYEITSTCQQDRNDDVSVSSASAGQYEPNRGPDSPSATLSQLEMKVVTSNYDELSVDALDWLFNVSSNPTVHSLVIQAIGGLPPDIEAYARATWEGQNEIRDVRHGLLIQAYERGRGAIGYESFCERLLRSICFVSDDHPCWQSLSCHSDDPRLTATVKYAAFSRVPDPSSTDCTLGEDLKKFFCTFNEVELHPLVWAGLVRSALTVNSNCFQVDNPKDLSSQDCAHIISLFLPASEPSWKLFRNSTHPMTLSDLLVCDFPHRGDISESAQGCLLNMLSSLDDDLPPTLPSRYRLLYKAAKFALHYVADELCASHADIGSCRHLELLSNILGILGILTMPSHAIHEKDPSLLPPMFDLLRTIIDSTPICDYNTPGWQHPKLHYLLRNSLEAIIDLSTIFVSSGKPEFAFPSFHRLLQMAAHYLSEWQHSFHMVDLKTCQLMDRGLAAGNEAMYRAFVDGQWIWMCAERCIVDFNNPFAFYSSTISGFLGGLQTLPSASALEFLDYMQQPRNFIMAFIMIASDKWPWSQDFLDLCPKDSSWWDTHRTTLDGIITWCQASNCNDLPFPLENFFNGKVVQTHKGAMFLDEELRGMFTLHRRKFEWAARTIILGEAAPKSLLEGDQSRLSGDDHELGVR